MGLTLGVTLLLLALCLGGREVLGEVGARCSDRLLGNSPASVPTAVPSGAQPDPSRFAGRWRSQTSELRVIVTPKGEVWSDIGTLQGSVLPSRTGANFAFGNGTFFCAYEVAFAGADTTEWGLVDKSAQTSCPSGRFTRPPFD